MRFSANNYCLSLQRYSLESIPQQRLSLILLSYNDLESLSLGALVRILSRMIRVWHYPIKIFMHTSLFNNTLGVLAILLFSSCIHANEQRLRIEITGASSELAANIQAYLAFSDEICPLSSRRLSMLRSRINQDVLKAGQALGYYDMDVKKEWVFTNDCWILKLKISPGPPIIVQHIDVQLSPEPAGKSLFRKWLADLPVKSGDQLNHGLYALIKSRLASIAAELGYFEARFARAELLIYQKELRAEIFIDYHLGPRYRFGNIDIEQTILDRDFIKRFLLFQEEDFYSSDALATSQRALTNSGYFDNVIFEPQMDGYLNERIDIKIRLLARKQFAYSLGVGATTDTGPRFKLAFENRYTTLSGHQFSSQLNLSPVRSEISGDYLIPAGNPEKEQIKLSSGYIHEDTDTALSDTYNIGIGYSHLYQNNWLRTYSLSFQREDFTLANEKNRSDLLIPAISWLKSKMDHPVYPLRGWRLFAQLRGSSTALGSDVSFNQFYYRAKYIRALGPGRLLARWEAGHSSTSQFEQLPATVRFFAGGDNSVRGYDYRELGPVDNNGIVIGGSHLWVWSLEYDYRLSDYWAIAAFYDQGNAFNSGDKNFMRGAGFGLRWLSPIGPIRFDIASAIDRDYDFRLHLSMGPDL